MYFHVGEAQAYLLGRTGTVFADVRGDGSAAEELRSPV
jgi:carbonic anhydrase